MPEQPLRVGLSAPFRPLTVAVVVAHERGLIADIRADYFGGQP